MLDYWIIEQRQKDFQKEVNNRFDDVNNRFDKIAPDLAEVNKTTNMVHGEVASI
ncbi:hypothetical protein MUB24_15230 [Lederbergia sp. NSJ-179]|uniref:hypothetical protein n=1 Tax=Lederbergia sp. NSJ-179 TaxID=2931402 RepID=UPI001FD2A92A|nr:hypothetical protein [Lederbergia sp. NSJ-179]MCJ7842226.1 hypothetical protein [Lederbergia sp. NSJ-179]